MNKAFTIIETLVAISILTISIMGAMSAIQSGLSSYIISKEQVVAFYLAQEGFEEVRSIRDENIINGRGWLTGIAANSSDPCYFGSSCSVSPVASTTPARCSAPGSCPALREDATTGFFGYNAAWTLSPYTREISITSINSNEISVRVTVTWSKGSIANTFKARENLLNW